MSCNATVTPFDLYHYEPNQAATIVFMILYIILTGIGIKMLMKYKEYKSVARELPSEHIVPLNGAPSYNNDSSTPYVILQSEHLPITWLSQGYRVILVLKLAAIHLLAGFIFRLAYIQTEATFFFAISNAYILLVPLGIAYLNDSVLLMLIRSSEQIVPHLAKTGPWYFRSRSLKKFLRMLDNVSLILIPMSFSSATDKDPDTRKGAQYMQVVGFIAQFIQICIVLHVTRKIHEREEYRASRPNGLNPLFGAILFSSIWILIRNSYRVFSAMDTSDTLLSYEWLFWIADIVPLTLVLITYMVYHPLPFFKHAISLMDQHAQPVTTNQSWDQTSPRSMNDTATSPSKHHIGVI